MGGDRHLSPRRLATHAAGLAYVRHDDRHPRFRWAFWPQPGPEALRRNLSGFWSRRIDDEHRLVYGATDGELIIIQARYHYDD